ncbi:uncharacterized protein LOC125032583 [Penaeus chinensis]|uniref:uncharacterized protein LOC125032583 n=1 Tax=Penaeus chinensis TaxID=139456 RepID=UPI001FB6EEA9|nr:uncharacterized protein LOC125032583 [Penaeus chinensis]XP_047479784.1 uncharacterized protein LOC125032583 [Penaeus chinensis]XP_047479785.1 uncharacterized protein LOC125032583 [Penaeus chinensis]XP_047479787.1 uncharacterized protein LOC125032583 [Penaeus chinensis]
MMNSGSRLSSTAARHDGSHGTTVVHRRNTSQNLPYRNQSFGMTHDYYNHQSFVGPSTSQNRSYRTTIASSRLQTDRDPYNTHFANTAKNQRDQFDAQDWFGRKRVAEVNAASTEGCITLDHDPIALFGAHYMQSDWYRALQSRPHSMYSDLARKLFTDFKLVPETGKIIIPTKYKTIFDDHDSRPFFPRHPGDSSQTALFENREDAQQSSKIRQPQQGCSNGAFGENRPKLPPKEDQSLNPSVLLVSKETGEDSRQENTFGEELIKTESFLQEEFGLQVKEEVPWW